MALPVAPPVPLQVVDGAPPLAGWWLRAAAVVLDHLILAGVTWVALGGSAVVPTLHPPLLAGGWRLVLRSVEPPVITVGGVAAVVATLIALVLLQAFTGATPGKRAVGVMVVRSETGRPAGVWRTVARPFAHLLDGLLLVGYLRPLWEPRRRTFADSVLGTVALRGRSPELRTWLAGGAPTAAARGRSTAVTATAVAASVLGGAFAVTWFLRTEETPVTAAAPCEVRLQPGGHLWEPAVSYEVVDTRLLERRGWIERPVFTPQTELRMVWTWLPDPSGSDPDASLTTSFSGLGPEQLHHTTWATSEDGRVELTMPFDHDELVGTPGRSVQAMLEISGQPIATCSVPAAAMTGG